MKWLVPLGFLGLLGLVALLLIYLIKPNFQRKGVSSTYVWKLSMRFQKKRNPITRLQDILLLILQILAIIALALIMAFPVIEAYRPPEVTQKIAVIDGSVSMLAQTDGETRFERALDEVEALAAQVTAEENGEISVIFAGETAQFVSVRTTAGTASELSEALAELRKSPASQCTNGGADVDGAMQLAEQVLDETPLADVVYYTSVDYIDAGDVEVVNVSDSSEYNVAILNAEPLLIENYYTFSVDIASYGRDADVTLCCDVYGANGNEDLTESFRLTVWLNGDEPQNVLINSETTGGTGIFSYQSVYIYVRVEDSFGYDNQFYLYGGTKETIRIQYVSSIPNIYLRAGIMSLRESLRDKWNIEYSEVNTAYREPETSGYDFYIYERVSVDTLPTDGVVMFVNPTSVPENTGIRLTNLVRSGNTYLAATGSHPITDGVNAGNIFISESTGMTLSDDFEVLLTCYRGETAFAVRNEETVKMVVMAFELQNSDLPIQIEFPRLFFQTFEYFFPSTLEQYNFEVGESVSLNARAPELHVSGQGTELTLSELPASVTLYAYGTYTLTQTLFTGKTVIENFYVKIPNAESDFTTVLEVLPNPYVETVPENEDYDLLIWIAAALVAALFLEWALNRRSL